VVAIAEQAPPHRQRLLELRQRLGIAAELVQATGHVVEDPRDFRMVLFAVHTSQQRELAEARPQRGLRHRQRAAGRC
jgi:hypothetical protein